MAVVVPVGEAADEAEAVGEEAVEVLVTEEVVVGAKVVEEETEAEEECKIVM